MSGKGFIHSMCVPTLWSLLSLYHCWLTVCQVWETSCVSEMLRAKYQSQKPLSPYPWPLIPPHQQNMYLMKIMFSRVCSQSNQLSSTLNEHILAWAVWALLSHSGTVVGAVEKSTAAHKNTFVKNKAGEMNMTVVKQNFVHYFYLSFKKIRNKLIRSIYSMRTCQTELKKRFLPSKLLKGKLKG